ncbi:MAG: DUF4397 domain-containing protein, partial [Polyangiales bacterium]
WLMWACSDDDDPQTAAPVATQPTGTAVTPATPAPQARLRALHLSPDAPAVDIFANAGAAPVVQGLAFLQGTDYLEIDPGSYDLAVTPTGAGLAAAVLNIDGLNLSANIQATAVAFDEVANIQALALIDDAANLAAGNIRVRAVHTASGVDQVDIWNLPAGAAPTPVVEDLDFAVSSDKLDLPAGAYTLGIDVDDDANPDLIYDLPDLPAGTVANVFAVADNADVFLVAQLQDGTVARVDARP